MPTNHDVWDTIAQSDGTPGNSFEMLVAVAPRVGGTFARSGDITNVNPAFTAKNRARQTYGAKGVNRSSKYGDDLVVTFDVEVVRDANGLYSAFLQDLINASKLIGVANQRRLQVYDALGADYAFEAIFSISVSRSGTGWDDASFFTVTATQYGTNTWITNPVLAGNVPSISLVSPATGAATGATLYIEGTGFTGLTATTGVKIGTANATSFTVVNDGLVTAVVPSGSAGSTYVRLTNANGVSNDYPIVRAA